MKNKKVLIATVVIGVVILCALLGALFSSQSTTRQTQISSSSPKTQGNAAPMQTGKQTGQVSPSTALPTIASDAQTVTKQFYTYFFSSPTNPLANGAYRNNPYLSQDFKDVITAYYKNGDVPVFCPQNKSNNIVVGQEQLVSYNGSSLTQEVISEAPPGTKDLYRVLLESVNNQWLIFDINCITQ